MPEYPATSTSSLRSGRDPLERLEQLADLVFPAIEPLGYDEPPADITLPQCELRDLAGVGPRCAAAGEIRYHALGALVAVLGALRQEPQDQFRQRPGESRDRADGALPGSSPRGRG